MLKGQRPDLPSLLLTLGNARRLADPPVTLEQRGDMALERQVGFEADGIVVALGLQKTVQVRQREGRLTPEEPPLDRAAAITRHHRLQPIAPAIGAVDVAGAQ